MIAVKLEDGQVILIDTARVKKRGSIRWCNNGGVVIMGWSFK